MEELEEARVIFPGGARVSMALISNFWSLETGDNKFLFLGNGGTRRRKSCFSGRCQSEHGLDFKLPVSGNRRQQISIASKTLNFWHFVRAALGTCYTSVFVNLALLENSHISFLKNLSNSSVKYLCQ